MNSERMRKNEILAAAIDLAERHGLHAITREQIADAAGVATGLVNFHFGTMTQLRRAVVGEALRIRNLPVIAQALAMGDPRARNAPEELRQAAAMSLNSGA